MADFLHALYWFCADYHSGQWSKGYQTLCLASHYLAEWYGEAPAFELNERQQELYNQLAYKHAEFV